MAAKKKLTFEQALNAVERKYGIVGVYAVNLWIDLEPRIDYDADPSTGDKEGGSPP